MAFISCYALAEESQTIQAKPETQEENTTSRFIPENERGLIGSSYGPILGWQADTGLLIGGNYTRALNEKISAGVTFGYDSYLNPDATKQSYLLYGSNLRYLLLDNVWNKSLDVAASFNFLNEKKSQLLQPGLVAKYVFRGTPHFLTASVFFDKFFNDEDYLNQFLSKSNTSISMPHEGYSGTMSYHYQLSDYWTASVISSYSNYKITKKEMFNPNHSISRDQKLELTPMIGFTYAQVGYGYDLLNNKWRFSAAATLFQATF